MSTVAEQLVGILLQSGVTRVYGVVGDSLNPFVDAIRRNDAIEWVHVRNAEAGAFDPNARSIPPHVTAAEVRGFALATAKIVLGGGVGRMLDMARSNLNIPGTVLVQ
jgi:hypothetical protein